MRDDRSRQTGTASLPAKLLPGAPAQRSALQDGDEGAWAPTPCAALGRANLGRSAADEMTSWTGRKVSGQSTEIQQGEILECMAEVLDNPRPIAMC